jgi:hypothetical protein
MQAQLLQVVADNSKPNPQGCHEVAPPWDVPAASRAQGMSPQVYVLSRSSYSCPAGKHNTAVRVASMSFCLQVMFAM